MNLTKREQYTIFGGCAFIVIFFLIQFIIMPFIDKKERLEKGIRVKTEILKKMHDLKQEYNQLQKLDNNSLVKNRDNFTLFSFLDKSAGQANIKNNIIYMKPSSKSLQNSDINIAAVEIKIKDISMQSLVQYVYKIETSPNNIFIKSFSIFKSQGETSGINAVLEAEAVEN